MITEQDVQYVANLSRIHIAEDKLHLFTGQLETILHYIKKLEDLDVSNVEPTSHALPLTNVFREDSVRQSLGQVKALEISKHTEKGAFKVPKVIE